MTVVVGYRAGEIGLSGLYLAVRIARTLGTDLIVTTIVPKPRLIPVSAERGRLAAESAAEALRYLDALAEGLEVTYRHRAHRSVSAGLIEVAKETNADVLVLVSAFSVRPRPAGGGVRLGSIADRLLHSSPVPVAIGPPGYRAGVGGFTRLTCACSVNTESIDAVRRYFGPTELVRVPLRVITFAVRGRTMYPPEVGVDVEDSILETWVSQAQANLQNLKTDGVMGENVVWQVVRGKSWPEALRAAEWQEGEIMALGTSSRGEIRRVFLGSRAAKIIRYSPVPVLVLPG